MASGSMDIRVRPIRVAFLVDPSISKDVYRAIELTSLLWGGMHNPIIPAYRRIPHSWGEKNLSAAALIAGYLEAFDPDYVVPVGKCSERVFEIGERELLQEAELLGQFQESLSPDYGVGLLELLYDFRDEELKYRRFDELHLAIPEFPVAYRTFLASVFGALAPELQKIINAEFSTIPSCKRIRPSLGDFINYLGGGRYYPRRLTTWKLKNQGVNETVIFICDAKKTIDIIDYWNLRASGRVVLPIPIQISGDENVKLKASDLIEDNYLPYRHNPDMFYKATVQKSRSVSNEKVRLFCQSLNIAELPDRRGGKYSVRNWYPRFWDSWARENAEGECILPYEYEENYNIGSEHDRIEIRSSNPKLKLFNSFSGKTKFVNEYHFRFFCSIEPMAEVIPEGSINLASCIRGLGFKNWRFSRSGVVFFANHKDDLVYMEPPRAEPVMVAWMREKGWEVSLSPPGRIAAELYKQVGGLHGASWLAHKQVIHLLEKLDKGSGLSWPAVIGHLKAVIGDSKFGSDPESFLGRLIESNAVRLGAKVQCPNCTRFNWYELNSLEYTLSCRFCLSEYHPPLKSPKAIEWSYRSYGPFASSTAQGSFSVLLTLMFFGQDSGLGITPLFSYTAKKGNRILESDLTCLYKSSMWRNVPTDVIHVECKSFNLFESKDVERMAELGQEFPGSVIVFSTLKDELDQEEVRMISELTLDERQKRLDGDVYNPVIVLTGVELFSIGGVTRCWEDREGKYQMFNKNSYEYLKLNSLADATQQLYLGLKSYFEWSQEVGE